MDATVIREKAQGLATRLGVPFEDCTGKVTIGCSSAGPWGWWQDSLCPIREGVIDLKGPWSNRTHGLLCVRFSAANGPDRLPAVSLVLTLVDRQGRVLKPRASGDKGRGKRWLIDRENTAVVFDGTETL